MAFVVILSQIKLLFGPLVIQLVWYNYTKTIIHLSVGESGGSGEVKIHDYSPPLRCITVDYFVEYRASHLEFDVLFYSSGSLNDAEVLNRGETPNVDLPSLDMSQRARTTSPGLIESNQ